MRPFSQEADTEPQNNSPHHARGHAALSRWTQRPCSAVNEHGALHMHPSLIPHHARVSFLGPLYQITQNWACLSCLVQCLVAAQSPWLVATSPNSLPSLSVRLSSSACRSQGHLSWDSESRMISSQAPKCNDTCKDSLANVGALGIRSWTPWGAFSGLPHPSKAIAVLSYTFQLGS